MFIMGEGGLIVFFIKCGDSKWSFVMIYNSIMCFVLVVVIEIGFVDLMVE